MRISIENEENENIEPDLSFNEAGKDANPSTWKKLKNWLYYNWYKTLGIIVLIFVLAQIAISLFHIGETMPDVRVAYIGNKLIDVDLEQSLEQYFEAFADDYNGDGVISVAITDYSFYKSEMGNTEEMDEYFQDAKILADVMECDSYFFVLEDPDTFQTKYGILTKKGSDEMLPSDSDLSDALIPYNDKLFIGARGFGPDKTCKYYDGCLAMWSRMNNSEN